MKKIILYFIFLFSSISSINAHGIDISMMMLVENDDNLWSIQIRSSLDAFRKEVRTHFADSPYKTPEEFKLQLLQHIRNTLKISVNNDDISLENGIVKLGHETLVYFDKIKIPKDLNSLSILGTMFKEISNNKTKLFVLKKNFDKAPFILNKNNNYNVNLIIEDNSFVTKNEGLVKLSNLSIIVLVAVILFILVLFIKFNKKYTSPKLQA